ncbi:MAG TPA: hypothetical protein VGO08_04010 [Burkholderiales bacterium]|jgi:hypothetical protein|nr:hypothetical protein [Burkholderiales bacterium]
MRTRTLSATTALLLLVTPLSAAGPQLPPMARLVAECRAQHFVDAICDPAPSERDTLGLIIGVPEAHLANGNTGSLWVTDIAISFDSNLNDEHVLLMDFTITGICADLTTSVGTDGTRAYATQEANRNYFRITSRKAALTFWVPGGREDTNNAARFYEHMLSTILPVEHCTLRSTPGQP